MGIRKKTKKGAAMSGFTETIQITEAAAAQAKKSGLMTVQLISPGWGSSGYYSTEVLEAAAADAVIPAGTQMYADHPTETEAIERPGRSIKDLMSVTTEDARIATTADVSAGADAGSLVAPVRVAAPYRELIEDLVDTIGVSIRGDATDMVEGEAEGRRGRIIEGLAHVASVDWVTRAGRGGRVLALMESARANQRALDRGIEEATVNDTREALVQVLRDAYPSADDSERGHWVYVRDFDASTVWFEIEGSDDAGIYGQDYTSADGAVSLSGERTEVRVVTTYVPTTRSDSTNTTQESEEDTMPNIEEAELTRLREDAGRVTALEERATTAESERDEARIERDRLRSHGSAVTRARARITEASANLPTATVDRIVAVATATVPLTESGELDTAALDTAVDTARTAEETYLAGLAEAAGVGSITGFGGTPTSGGEDISEAQIDAAVGSIFGRQVKEA